MRARSAALVSAAAVFAVLGGSGCGHPASVKECEEIIDRIVRLEIKQHVGKLEPAEVQREVDTTKQKLRQTTMKDCAGKRIYESTMHCVREAKTSKAIVEDCFD
jgi:hypothetical protein